MADLLELDWRRSLRQGDEVLIGPYRRAWHDFAKQEWVLGRVVKASSARVVVSAIGDADEQVYERESGAGRGPRKGPGIARPSSFRMLQLTKGLALQMAGEVLTSRDLTERIKERQEQLTTADVIDLLRATMILVRVSAGDEEAQLPMSAAKTYRSLGDFIRKLQKELA